MAMLHSELNEEGKDQQQFDQVRAPPVEMDRDGLDQTSEVESNGGDRAAAFGSAAGSLPNIGGVASSNEMNVLLLNQSAGTNAAFQKKAQISKVNTNIMQGGYL